jgi:hypothetical protein
MESFPIGLPEMLWASIFVVASVGYFWALIDAAKRPSQEWRDSGMNKALWILGLLIFPWAGLFFYVVIARPRFTSFRTLSE